MFKRTVNPEDLTRLKQEREDADQDYNDALTRLDGALQTAPEPSTPPSAANDSVASLTQLSRVALPDPGPADAGWRGWVRQAVGAVVGGPLARQQEFNRAVAERLDTGATMQRAEIERLSGLLHAQLSALVTFQLKLILYVQQITPYVDTKDHEMASILRRINEDNGQVIDHLMKRADGITVGLETATRASQAATESVGVLREAVRATQSALTALKRQVERSETVPTPRSKVTATNDPPAQPSWGNTEDAYKYVVFEDTFRGDRADIQARQRSYLTHFEQSSDVLDIGCGRGEFLELLREHNIPCRGLDINAEMVELCRDRGLDVTHADGLTLLRSVPDESLGGIFAAQVVEHLPPQYLVQLLDAAHRKLRPNSALILETINPACWTAFFEAYLRDLTHQQPVHPDTLRNLLHASGFSDVDIVYSSPHAEDDKLQRITIDRQILSTPFGKTFQDLSTVFNDNVDALNARMFGDHDYAAIAKRF